MIKELVNEIDLINELETSFKDNLKDIKSDLENNPFSHYIIYYDNGILGYLNYYLIYNRIEIANFNVLEKYQNKGIGSKLLAYLINKYEKVVDNITLEVRSNNPAVNLYKKYGFKEVAIRKNYYDGIDGILMERK